MRRSAQRSRHQNLVPGQAPAGPQDRVHIDGVKCAVEAYSWGRFFTCTGQRWQNAPLSITPHQADIETALEIAAKLAKPSPAAEAAAAGDGPIAEGRRHEALKKMGIKLRVAGMNAIEIEAALLAYNAKRCSPPKPEAEVRDIVKWVAEHRFDGAVDPATLAKLAGVDGETIYTTPVKDVKAVVEGFIYPGCTIFNARPKIGKSWLMLQAAYRRGQRIHHRGPSARLPAGEGSCTSRLEETEARTTRRMRKLTPPNPTS